MGTGVVGGDGRGEKGSEWVEGEENGEREGG